MLKCHARLLQLYTALSDEESADVASKAVTALTQELELFCNLCGQRYGHRDEALQALPCSHLFHQRFVSIFLKKKSNFRCLHKYLASPSSSKSSNCLKCHAQQSARQHRPSERDCSSSRHRRTKTPVYAPVSCLFLCLIEYCSLPAHPIVTR